ncbi:tigger transposable element-derived protein 6-like protein [Elysia marginata]|uniref:Tigger transposable element-derived protein 6-like protein n=1 Tax=Elysia marginata TaxID=1093978 RepID=A0AAV4G9J1_9GAST|nr:tigger transposable element-derived protein 6-like protein [Elysia marginata]
MSEVKKKEKSYSQELLETAIDLVKSGKVGLKQASRDFKIPYSTLGEKIRGRRPVKAGTKYLLLAHEEKKIVDWVKVHEDCALPRSIEDLRKKVKEVVELRGGSTKTKDGLPGKDWILAFRRRYPALSLTTPKAQGKEWAVAPCSANKAATATRSTTIRSPPPSTSPCESFSLSASAPPLQASTLDKWDSMKSLLQLADKLGLNRSMSFLTAAKSNTLPEEDDSFRHFQKLLVDIGLCPDNRSISATQNTSASASSGGLDAILAAPKVTKTKSRKVLNKGDSSACTANSQELRVMLKRKEELSEEDARAKKPKKAAVAKSKETKDKNKEDQFERNRLKRQDKLRQVSKC